MDQCTVAVGQGVFSFNCFYQPRGLAHQTNWMCPQMIDGVVKQTNKTKQSSATQVSINLLDFSAICKCQTVI